MKVNIFVPTQIQALKYLSHFWYILHVLHILFYLRNNNMHNASIKILFHRRFRITDVPSTVLKGLPNSCTVYVVGKGKLSYVRAATSAPQLKAPPCNQMQHQPCKVSESNDTQMMRYRQARGLSL